MNLQSLVDGFVPDDWVFAMKEPMMQPNEQSRTPQ
jgi:hypothetical protein